MKPTCTQPDTTTAGRPAAPHPLPVSWWASMWTTPAGEAVELSPVASSPGDLDRRTREGLEALYADLAATDPAEAPPDVPAAVAVELEAWQRRPRVCVSAASEAEAFAAWAMFSREGARALQGWREAFPLTEGATDPLRELVERWERDETAWRGRTRQLAG